MPTSLIRKIAICLALAAPAIFIRFSGIHVPAPLLMLIFGIAVVAAAFLLAWAAEAAQKDISGSLAIALLALIAVLPEYAVDLYYAFRSGSELEYAQYAAANMTGSNRLLPGFGWPLVVIIALYVLYKRAKQNGKPTPRSLTLLPKNRLDIAFLLVLGALAFAIPLFGSIPLWFGILLIVIFALYLWRAGKVESEEDEDMVGAAAQIAQLEQKPRRITVVALFLTSATIILICAEPFAESLVESGSTLGIDSFFLVQWIAPLASEAPEFIIACMFAARGKGALAIGTLIASKVNQWSLLVGSLPVAHFVGGGTADMGLDARQIEEFVLTATQTLLGVAIILALRFRWQWAVALAALFAVQFFVTSTEGRYILSAIQAALAIGIFVMHWRYLIPTLKAPWQLSKLDERPVPELDRAATR